MLLEIKCRHRANGLANVGGIYIHTILSTLHRSLLFFSLFMSTQHGICPILLALIMKYSVFLPLLVYGSICRRCAESIEVQGA